MTTYNIKPFDYQEARFFIGLKVKLTKPFKTFPEGTIFIIDGVADRGFGCVLTLATYQNRLKHYSFDRRKFFSIFELANFDF